jgi:UDPglucose 6-dehydrogenase
VGQGYVGLAAATGLAEAGHSVVGIEVDPGRLGLLRAGRAPIYEPGLQELLGDVVGAGHLTFADRLDRVGFVEAVVVAVGSPPLPSGSIDLSQVKNAMAAVRALHPAPRLVVVKSTMTPGTSDRLLAQAARQDELADRYVYNPEFLNQGTALEDWRKPDRVVVGLRERALMPLLRDLYREVDAPWVITTPKTAEMIKYASNAFLAAKISFSNEIANLCDEIGADVDELINGVSLDQRIGGDFLRPGLGYGDSCLPKDTLALSRWANLAGRAVPLLQAVIAVNEAQPFQVARILQRRMANGSLEGLTVAVLGLRYEPWSDDLRAAPSLKLVPELSALGARVRAWDPGLDEATFARLLPGVERSASLADAVGGSGATLALTEWPEIVAADWAELARTMEEPRLVIDGKNCLRPRTIAEAGLDYRGIGRSLNRENDPWKRVVA